MTSRMMLSECVRLRLYHNMPRPVYIFINHCSARVQCFVQRILSVPAHFSTVSPYLHVHCPSPSSCYLCTVFSSVNKFHNAFCSITSCSGCCFIYNTVGRRADKILSISYFFFLSLFSMHIHI